MIPSDACTELSVNSRIREPKKKPKKLRSIRLSKNTSFRRGKTQSDCYSTISSDHSTPSQTSICSDEKKESSQASPSYSESSSGAVELKKKLEMELADFDNSMQSTGRAKGACASPNYFKGTSSSDARKLHFKASPNSESASDPVDENRINLNQSSPNSVKRLVRKSSMKPVRVLTKTISLRHRRPSTRKGLMVSQSPNLGVHKATCSSTLKGSKIPDVVEIQPEGNVILAKKVCPYTYCSLHGHKHDTSPPVKQFISARRQLLKSQKGTKPENQSPQRAKQSGAKKKRSQNSQMAKDVNLKIHGTAKSGVEAKSKEASIAGDGEAICNIGNVAEVMLGDTSYPLINSEENLQQISAMDKKKTDISVSNHENACSHLEEDDLSNEPKVLIPDDVVAITCLATSASVSNSLQEPSTTIEERKGDGFSQLMVSPQSSTDEETNTPLRKQNYASLWNLIYRQMASENVAKDGPIEGNTLQRINSSGSSKGISRADSDKFAEDNEAGNQEIELTQTDAIKLVQEAINRILYPGAREFSFDEQSIASDTTSDQDIEKLHGEGEGLDISTSTDPDENNFCKAGRIEVDCKILEDQEMLLAPKGNAVHSEEKGEFKEISKSKQIASKRWSNLKKVILMKRFVKALERMRNFNPQKPKYLALEPDPEPEKVSLRRQMMEERKNAEEFMLDYALRQVISKLAPAQKKRVELLVNAFETVIPPSKNVTPSFRINSGASSLADHAQAWNGSSEPSFGATRKENNGANRDDTFRSQTSTDVSIKTNEDQFCNSLPVEQHCQVTIPENKETTSGGHLNAEPEARDTEQNVQVNCDIGDNKVIHRVMETTSKINPNGNLLDMSGRSAPENIKGSTATNNVISSHYVLQTQEPAENYKNEEAKPANKDLPEFCPAEEPDPDCSAQVTPETPLAKQNYTRLWYMVYKHMASGVTDTDGTQPTDGADKKGPTDDVESVTLGSSSSPSGTDQDMRREDDKINKQKEKLQAEAVKLVQEAIDQILLPEVEDHFSDNQSVSSDTPPEHELLEKNSEGGELRISTSPEPVKDTCRNPNKMEVEYSTATGTGETVPVSKILDNQGERTTLKEGGKSDMRAPKNWSNLKKLILLRRFVKALEKVRKLNPQAPRFLPLEPDAEAEKVNLRHQEMEDRKNAEEWMLDYAIQQVVTKLTPARKKKVQLLVEAFEMVTPMENETYMGHSPAATSRAHPFKSVLGR